MAMLIIHSLVNMKKLLQDICSKIFYILIRGKLMIYERWISSVQFSHSVVSNSLEPMDCGTPGFTVHHQLPELALTHVYQVGDAIQPSILCPPVLLLPSIFPSIRVFPNESVFHIKYWSSQSIGVSALASVLPVNIQDWFPFGLTGWISLQSKGLSRVFSNITVQKHQFFGTLLSL